MAGLRFESERPIAISDKGIDLESANLRIDLIVENVRVVQLKAVEKVMPVHEAQLLT